MKILALLLMIYVSGCATLHRFANFPNSPQIYGGIRTHIEDFPYGHVAMLDQGGDWSGIKVIPGMLLIWWLPADIALSLALDTLALPATIPAESGMQDEQHSWQAQEHLPTLLMRVTEWSMLLGVVVTFDPRT